MSERADLSRPMDAFDLEWVRKQLAAQGLHVVSAADQAVLDAMADLRSEWLIAMLRSDRTFPIEPICVARVRLHEAELARREQKP